MQVIFLVAMVVIVVILLVCLWQIASNTERIADVLETWAKSQPKSPPSECTKCGYDLRGNTSGTCPECGTSLAAMAGGEDE